MNATAQIAKAQMAQVQARVDLSRARLQAAETKVQKEIKKKSAAGKLALDYNNAQKAAQEKALDEAHNEKSLREWNSKVTALRLRIEELKVRSKVSNKKLDAAVVAANKADKVAADDAKQEKKNAEATQLAANEVKKAQTAIRRECGMQQWSGRW